ncbi:MULTISPECIES: MBL fold metallo-hydrolase RNA specificity domain-containing protein [Comamonas]|uniref:MBL fold metallo-hydrolase n=1 Tax=Comamonas terrigena TaxID=32013 RepID=A0A2A7UWX9_COMTR|nr:MULTISPECIES: MBL fold metallo-hydrolase [Comamonas]MBD9531382.1 MBL fold metallo-hydrolase [Comamonas sp. CMM01]MDH0050069.1 MBL fold metallo-hydrolase [Comamonas terrigena]MDH0512367.1 MBL fold metallo-hydrolase [Comamonas terrigena]MDH1091893.1 MBL fold metallo-hydrolase [Comamonas terrigena]MDH1502037.1 MBL fold metallo-hydrolase [Comamonas terrigena]
MQITFYGAAQTVTGSCFLVELGDCRFLIDCGMAQGGHGAQEHNQQAFGFDPRRIDFVLLTHAHIDHSGLLPKLAARGFRGPIYATAATADLLDVLLKDSAHIQMMEVERQQRRAQKSVGKHAAREPRHGREPALEPPLYTVQDAELAVSLVQAKPYNQTFSPHPAVKVRMRDAGHILGSAILEIWLSDALGGTRKLVASGDLGQPGRPILRDPTPIADADVLLIESTYGDRLHKDSSSTLEELVEVVNRTVPRGNVVIPAFAVGRTQELLYHFAQLATQQRLAPMEIFVDSPMAVTATAITLKHFAAFDAETRQLLGSPQRLAQWRQLHFISDVEDSIKLNRIKSGAVILSASGMCDAGRVLHHLHNNLGRAECAVLICGFQAAGSLGRRLVDGEKRVRLMGDDIAVRASVHTLGGFSAHADQKALLDWAGAFTQAPKQTFVVHGEAKSATALSERLQALPGWGQVTIPALGNSYRL